MTETLPTARVAALDESEAAEAWLVRSIWTEQAVGFIGGAPKCCKSWLGLDLAVSVASGTPCLDRFEVERQGPALIFLAEDALPEVRRRIDGLCRHRRLSIQELDLHVITAPSLRLDLEADQRRLAATLARLRPTMLLLDPLIRMHRLDENSAGDISGLLGLLRHLQREHQVAIAVVHHMSKRSRAQLGQALRGSTDLHAWSDSAAYLVRRRSQLRLSLEHRSAAAPEPFAIELVADEAGAAHLQLVADDALDDLPPPPLADAVRRLLAARGEPMTRTAIRRELRVNNQRLGDALTRLERDRIIERGNAGWSLIRRADPHQLEL
jgi:hypothetical protein